MEVNKNKQLEINYLYFFHNLWLTCEINILKTYNFVP